MCQRRSVCVEFEDSYAAEKAISKLDGLSLHNRQLSAKSCDRDTFEKDFLGPLYSLLKSEDESIENANNAPVFTGTVGAKQAAAFNVPFGSASLFL